MTTSIKNVKDSWRRHCARAHDAFQESGIILQPTKVRSRRPYVIALIFLWPFLQLCAPLSTFRSVTAMAFVTTSVVRRRKLVFVLGKPMTLGRDYFIAFDLWYLVLSICCWHSFGRYASLVIGIFTYGSCGLGKFFSPPPKHDRPLQLWRIVDIMLAMPSLLWPLPFVAILGQAFVNAALAISIVSLPLMLRLTRARHYVGNVS